ncbi:aldo/keto reductase [Myxococcus sp. AM009]|uniref:aldo/keto reductase n=1 Tax=unclassified Myxococcus TaxID=2648731 RepID=UPI001595F3DB|nr:MULTISPECIES: aldo/keto reductase [unclassified Myxococcus]NVI98853.1 aldo/keto reductase [Myxococcus sp. AM009]NVJ15526.1 aldo/keto reductase [Myxococcus sp. AM010]
MERRPLGRTGLQVSVLGFGAGHVGGPALAEAEAAALLHGVLDAGINLIDTAPGYGASEERIGRHLRGRRSEFVLSTKCGYGVPGVEDWTPECITRGVDQALMRLRTDVLDVVHFHSCPLEVLQRPGLVEALVRAVEAGKVRAAAYSGDNAALEYALETGAFAVVQTSVNLFDQRAIERGVAWARARGMGVIAKRPLGNAPWRFAERPSAHDLGEYWHRMRTLALDSRGLDWSDVALRFAAHVPGVSTCIVGTGRLEHLRRNIQALEEGPLPSDFVEALRDAFRRCGAGWDGLI